MGLSKVMAIQYPCGPASATPHSQSGLSTIIARVGFVGPVSFWEMAKHLFVWYCCLL